MRPLLAIVLIAALGACSPQDPNGRAAVPPADAPPSPARAAKPAPQAALPADFAGDIDAVGTEPFWLLAIRKDELKLTRPDQADVATPAGAPVMEDGKAVWATPSIKVTLSKATCSDGMSDRSFPLTAEVVLGATLLKGCADRAAASPPAR